MSDFTVSDETQARINDVLLDAYNLGRAAFAADLAEQGKVVVDRDALAEILDQARSTGRTSLLSYHRLMAAIEGRIDV